MGGRLARPRLEELFILATLLIVFPTTFISSSRMPQPDVKTLQSLPPTKSITHELLLLLDLDRNGLVNSEEFERLLEQYNLQSADHFDIAPEEGKRFFQQLDVDGNHGISQEEIATAMRRNSTFVRMSSEDVQVWLDFCTDGLKQYRAHFLESDLKGIDLVHATHLSSSFAGDSKVPDSDASSTNTKQSNRGAKPATGVSHSLIDESDQKYLRAAVIGGLLRSYYGMSHAPLIPAPKLVETRSTIITVGIVQPPSLKYRARVVKYKVQVCRTSGNYGWQKHTSTVPECGFGWNSIWPSSGVSTVRFIGLSPMTSYRFRVRAFHCDGKSIVGDELDVSTRALPTKTGIVLSPAKWLRMCFLAPITPSKLHVISTTPNSVLLEWGHNCKVRASYLRMLSDCSDVFASSSLGQGPGWDVPGLSHLSGFLRSQMYCTRQRFVVQYVLYRNSNTGPQAGETAETFFSKMTYSMPGTLDTNRVSIEPTDAERTSKSATSLRAGIPVDALCSVQDENSGPDGGNDNPLDCLVRGLEPGRMYLFRLAVEADGMLSQFTEPVAVSSADISFSKLQALRSRFAFLNGITRFTCFISLLLTTHSCGPHTVLPFLLQHMTHCISDSDCTSWIDTPNATCNPSTHLCDGIDPHLLKQISWDAFVQTPTTPMGTILNYLGAWSFLITLGTLVLMMAIAIQIFGPVGLGKGAHLAGYDNRWSGRRLSFVQDYHDPALQVMTEYAEDMVGLERLQMIDIDKWPSETLRGATGFSKLHFLKAFDIKFGKTVYRVRKYLGGGSFGRVFLATAQVRKKNISWYSGWLRRAGGYRPKGESLAIKFLPNSNMPEVFPGTLARRERAKFVGQTLFWTTEQNVWNHPSAPPNPFVVMETAEMGEVRNYQAGTLREGPKFFREEVARRIFSQLVQAVAFLHQKQFLHLDIKLENVLINIRGDVKLIDFGCCKRMEVRAIERPRSEDSVFENSKLEVQVKGLSNTRQSVPSMDSKSNIAASVIDNVDKKQNGIESADTKSSSEAGARRSTYAALIEPALNYAQIEMSFDEAENCGSKCIRAPELTPSYDDDRPARCDARSDLWSCGVCLLSMLQGTYELVSQDVKDNILVDGQYHLYLSDWENVLDVLSCYGEGGAVVSDDAQDLLAGLLQPDPEFRIKTAREVLSHKWLDMKIADDDMLASMMVANNAEQVEKGLALIPSGTAEQVLPFYKSLSRELKSRKKMLEKMRDTSKKSDIIGSNMKKSYSPHRRPNQRRLSQMHVRTSTTTSSPTESPSSSPSLDTRKTPGGIKSSSPLAIDSTKSSGALVKDHYYSTSSEMGNSHSNKDTNSNRTLRRPRSSTMGMTNSESLLGPFSETALARFQRDHLKIPQKWKGPIEWLFQFRRITHPAQVNPTLLKQAIRDVEPDVKDSALANRLKFFKKRLSEFVVKPLHFPDLRMSMRQLSTGQNQANVGFKNLRRVNSAHRGFGNLRTGSGPARARRNRVTFGDVTLPLSVKVGESESSVNAAAAFSQVKGLRRRRQSFSLGAKSLKGMNPKPLSEKYTSSALHSVSDPLDQKLNTSTPVMRLGGRSSSLWIHVRTVEVGVQWTNEQWDYLKNDFGISNVSNSQNLNEPSLFSIDGQRLADLAGALGLGGNPIQTLLERSKIAVEDNENVSNSMGTGSLENPHKRNEASNLLFTGHEDPQRLHNYSSPLPSPLTSPSHVQLSALHEETFSAAKLAVGPSPFNPKSLSNQGPLRSSTKSSVQSSATAETTLATEENNVDGRLVLTPVMKSKVYTRHREIEELRLGLMQSQEEARKKLVSKQVLEKASKHDRQVMSYNKNDSLAFKPNPIFKANCGLDWFKDFHPDVQARIYTAFRLYRFAPGQTICKCGDWVHGVHVIIEGGAYVSAVKDEFCSEDSNGQPAQETGQWYQPFDLINSHVLKMTVPPSLRCDADGNVKENNDTKAILSATASEVGHMLSKTTICAAEDNDYDNANSSDSENESGSDIDDTRSVVSTEGSPSLVCGGCTTMFLDAKIFCSILVQALRKDSLIVEEE